MWSFLCAKYSADALGISVSSSGQVTGSLLGQKSITTERGKEASGCRSRQKWGMKLCPGTKFGVHTFSGDFGD